MRCRLPSRSSAGVLLSGMLRHGVGFLQCALKRAHEALGEPIRLLVVIRCLQVENAVAVAVVSKAPAGKLRAFVGDQRLGLPCSEGLLLFLLF